MNRSGRWSRVLVLALVGLVAVALATLYLTAPPPTRLTVWVVDGETGAPLAGASVEVRAAGEAALPTALSDESGAAHLDNVAPDPAYQVRVQSVGYEITSQAPVAVAEGAEVEVTVALAPATAGWLYVGLDQAQIVEIDAASGLVMRTIQVPGAPSAPVRYLRAHPTEALLHAVAGDEGLILDTDSGAVVARLAVEGPIESLDLSADGHYVLVTTVQGGIDASGMLGRVLLQTLDAHSGQLVGETLLTGSQSATLGATYWEAADNQPGKPLTLTVPATGGQALALKATGAQDTAHLSLDGDPVPELLWQPDGTDVIVLQVANRAVAAMPERGRLSLGVNSVPVGPRRLRETGVLSADEAYLYSFGRYYSRQGESADYVELVATDDGTRLAEPYPLGIAALAASPVKLELYILNRDLGNLTLLDLTGERAQTVVAVGKSPQALTVSPDGTWIYVANTKSQSISLVHAPSASVAFTIPLPGEPISLAAR